MGLNPVANVGLNPVSNVGLNNVSNVGLNPVLNVGMYPVPVVNVGSEMGLNPMCDRVTKSSVTIKNLSDQDYKLLEGRGPEPLS